MRNLTLKVESRSWPLRQTFSISRGSRDHVEVVCVSLGDGVHEGRGECVPYARYGETVKGVMQEISALEGDLHTGLDRKALQTRLPPGAARNALDCAFWDLEAARSGKAVWQLAKLPQPTPVLTAYTISLGCPETMAEPARKAASYPLLKLKLGGDGDAERIEAISNAVPQARLIADANEAWTQENFAPLMKACAKAGVEVIEQPLPANEDEALVDLERPVPLCADESIHTIKDLERLKPLYDMINIKLDKTGGLTGAIKLAEQAKVMGLDIMIGCMVGSSLAMAPAALLAPLAAYTDLDAPLLLGRDQDCPMVYEGAIMQPPPCALWGC
jgi:L-alanine-DL-glutamate epimerase-like enolase superfamily enzyme